MSPGAGSSLRVAPLTPADRDQWEVLFRGYIAFYERTLPDERYDQAWEEFRSGVRMHALGVRLDGELIGIAHFLIHANTSGPDVCYLQDLFTAPEARGKGVARALIAEVGHWAQERGCSRVYWLTQSSNETARRLYDQVAENRGFIQYAIQL